MIKNTLSRKEAQRIVDTMTMTGTKYKYGYCCFYKDNLTRSDLKEIGYNYGAYGWNFTLYYHEASDTLYCDSYRYAPKNNFNN